MINPLSLLFGWVLDLVLGDPQRIRLRGHSRGVRLPHPVVCFGRMISFCEYRFNKGRFRKLKGAVVAVTLILLVFGVMWALRELFSMFTIPLSDGTRQPVLFYLFDMLLVFYCLAGTTLIREVRQVFLALDRSLDEGRRQVARIVGRDTSELSAQEVMTAALETLAENLSDGVVAPLFWLALLGTPGMLTYKMVNTLDSMIGYRTMRYRAFGCWAAYIDDVANYLPARLTALLMILVSGRLDLLSFVWCNGSNHTSPNSGYPEAALAGILDCRFGGPHYYFGELFKKPYIGDYNRLLTKEDMQIAVRVNRMTEVWMVGLVAFVSWICY